jgi:hypothetical protein
VVKPVVEAILDLLDAASVAGGSQGLPVAGQVDGFLQEAAQGLQVGLLLVRDNVVKVLAAAQQVAIATALGDFEDVVTLQAINYQVAIEIGTEDVFAEEPEEPGHS